MNFWLKLKRPIIILAPMADVTDAAFRRLIVKYSAHKRQDGTVGGPDVMWTEFVSADGLMRATKEGKEKLLADFIYAEEERPIVAQIFSGNEEHMEKAAKLCRKLGFDGIDINMGCPDRAIERQGAGSAMIKHPTAATDIIKATKRGAGDLPVSVKTRLGYNQDELETWLPELLKAEPAAVTFHARTRKEMSKVPARWERIARAVAIRDDAGSQALIFGNGDLTSVADAKQKVLETRADGAMLGRAIFGNPWLFHPEKDATNVSVKEKLTVMLEHTHLFTELLPHKHFAIMKKHYKAYVNGFDGAKELRTELMAANTTTEISSLVHRFINKNF